MPMTLKQAQRIAGKVGARIKAVPSGFEVTIPGRSVSASGMTFTGGVTPRQACHAAIIETGKHSQRVLDLCKKVYVEEDLLFDSEEGSANEE